MAVGADIGTYNLVVCTRNKNKNFTYKREVNAFLEIPLENRFVFNMMKNAGVPLIERQKVAYALGEASIHMAYTMSDLELKRPMKDGCVNPKEKDAFDIMNVMIHSLLEGAVTHDNEVVYYSVPANALNEETDADYHSKILEAILKAYESEEGHKITPMPINEALALVYAELQEKNWTGIGVSCLVPGTRVYTRRGILPIEEVVIGDEVITHKGRWKKVYNTIAKNYKGKATKIKSGPHTYDFVENHKLFVKKYGGWNWAGSEDLEIGDIIGEPIIKHNPELKPIEIELEERVTSSKLTSIRKIKVNKEVQRLIGYYLGDGSYNLKEGCIQFDFGVSEKTNIEDVSKILENEFDKNCSFITKSKNCTRVKCYSRSLTDWFAEKIGKRKDKKYPWSIEQLTNEECLHLLIGLIRSDGESYSEQIKFGNTNTSLIILAKQLFSRLGIPACINWRRPRKGGTINGREIIGKLPEFKVIASQVQTLGIFNELLDNLELDSTKTRRPRTFIEDDYCCTRIHKVKQYEYEGLVYDLQVEDDHSFSGPFLMISNCGAGMVNVCYSIFGNPAFKFSLVNSGDWIDKMAAKATGENTTYINQEKENIDLSKPPVTLVHRAIQTQYNLMIEKTISGIKKGLSDSGKKVRTDQPVDIILAGGTSMPKGFDELFRNILTEAELPIKIGDVRRPADPLYSVARGALIAGENSDLNKI